MKRYLSSIASTAALALLCVAAPMASLLSGCGSASRTVPVTSDAISRSEQGSATLTINWPARTTSTTRLIPAAANSILVTLTLNGATVGSQVATRPFNGGTSTLTFAALPIGSLGVTAIAVPDTNLNPATPTVHSTPDASGKGVISIAANKTTALTITMASTISTLQIVPSSLYLPLTTAQAVQTADVEALDASGAMVLLSPSTVSWQIQNPIIASAVADASDTGVTVTGLVSGDTTLFATESESGKVATIPVVVRGPLAGIRITTITPVVNVTGVVKFAYVGVDSAGNVIPNTNISGATWTTSNPSIATVDSTGTATAHSVGGAQGVTSAPVTITLSAGGFTDNQVMTVNAGTGGDQFSPTALSMHLSTSQYFTSWVSSPTSGLNKHNGTGYTIVIPTGGIPGTFGSLTQLADGECIYTTPAVQPVVITGGTPSPITQIVIQASDGLQSTVTLVVP